MKLSRNQRIAAAIVGIAVLTVTSISIVKAGRKRKASKRLDSAKSAKKEYDHSIEKVAHTISEIEKSKEKVLMTELKDLVTEHEDEMKDEFIERMENIILVVDDLKQRKLSEKSDNKQD